MTGAAGDTNGEISRNATKYSFSIQQARPVTCVGVILCVFIIVRFLSCYGVYNYTHIPREEIPRELYRETTPSLARRAPVPCTYDDILASTHSIQPWQVPHKFDDFLPTGIVNGSYVPEKCHPAFSVAILVTYRNRQKQLDVFLPYIHNFLRKQNIHYKIFLIEQQDDKPWNKGLLYNIGARHALAEQFPCLVLHDVDMLPLDAANLYACTRQPRHLSGSLDKFRFMLIYEWLVGGVMAMRADQYVAVGGFSNRFQGWGGEDDDLAERIHAHSLHIQRFPRTMSRYSMLRHPAAAKNPARRRILAKNPYHRAGDGLHHVWYDTLEVNHHRLFTWIRVKL